MSIVGLGFQIFLLAESIQDPLITFKGKSYHIFSNKIQPVILNFIIHWNDSDLWIPGS